MSQKSTERDKSVSSEYLDIGYDAPDRNFACLIRLRERSFLCVDKVMHRKVVEYKADCPFAPLLLPTSTHAYIYLVTRFT
jgi:hypothetical protein